VIGCHFFRRFTAVRFFRASKEMNIFFLPLFYSLLGSNTPRLEVEVYALWVLSAAGWFILPSKPLAVKKRLYLAQNI
jgi:hypothetical protein